MKIRNIILVVLLSWSPWLVGWATGPLTDVGNGWTTDTSTAGAIIWKYNGTEKVRMDSNGDVTAVRTFVGVNVDVSGTVECDIAEADTIRNEAANGAPAFPYGITGTGFNWASGNVTFINATGTGVPDASDNLIYYADALKIDGGGQAFVVNVDASGTVECDIVEADTVRNEAGTGAPTFSYGISTSDGYGIGVGKTAPTTNAIALEGLAAASPPVADAGDGLLFWSSTYGRLYFQDSSGQGDIRFDDAVANRVLGSTILNTAGNGAPNFSQGLTGTSADFSGTVECDTLEADTYKTEGAVTWASVGATGYVTFSHPICLPNEAPVTPAAGTVAIGWNDSERDLEGTDDDATVDIKSFD